ncbi:hypothetical protein V6N11_020447 [Hibiscus sabdariffa]|uniref:ATPase AAA-type core domain-containing protein n=1 Tax=Hibiscus sabdariffa TaxID=183260 RepID=A0ABR2Q8F9_9ROSI
MNALLLSAHLNSACFECNSLQIYWRRSKADKKCSDMHLCIVFMDEIDASVDAASLTGQYRFSCTFSECGETVTNLDSFVWVKVIVATNRPDILYRALLRLGQLDRKKEIPLQRN